MAQTLLLLGGSHSEVPLILAAKAMGLRVVTSGNRPEDIGYRYAGAFYHFDYSVREDVLAMAESLKPPALLSGANDFAVLSAAFVAERIGLPGNDLVDVSRTLHYKQADQPPSRSGTVRTCTVDAIRHPA